MIFVFQRAVLQHIFLAAIFLFSFQATGAGSDEPAPVLRLATGSVSANGHVKIEWDHSEGGLIEVQQSESETFETARIIYRGADKATFVSGLENGTYYYRVREHDGAWSAPATLTVRHHSLRLAIILFMLGAIVFALTVFIVVKGALKASND